VVECLEYQNQQKAGGIAEHDKIEVEYGRRFKCKDNGVVRLSSYGLGSNL
jgi:hypothetical protein